MWPNGPKDVNTDSDNAWKNSLGSKSYMMGVSPWFFTDLPGYNKAWVWRGDNAWWKRWTQVNQLLPAQVEIVTWNDFGESHYIGPIYNNGIPSGSNTNAHAYVDGYPHQAWLETLPYQIASYKHAYNGANAAPTVSADKIVYWFRTSPADAGSTDATGNNCKSNVNIYGYQQCYPIDQILEDQVFAIVLSANGGSASIQIGNNGPQTFNVNKGINFISKPFSGQTGPVTVKHNSASATGQAITSQPNNGKANFNAWVGCAGACLH